MRGLRRCFIKHLKGVNVVFVWVLVFSASLLFLILSPVLADEDRDGLAR